MRARLKKLLQAIQKEDAAIKREGLESLNEQQLKDVSYFYNASLFIIYVTVLHLGVVHSFDKFIILYFYCLSIPKKQPNLLKANSTH